MTTRLGGALVFAGAGTLLVAALVVATSGPTVGLLVCGVVAALTVLVVIGPTRAGIAALVLAFATAPMYRGLEGLTGGLATPTDLLVVVATMLLLPGVIGRRLRLPPVFVGGLVIVALCGLISSLASAAPLGSIFVLVQWLFFLGGVPVLIAWWRPGMKTVVTLLWAYVAGQTLNTAYALATGPVVGNRYQGLSHHTNAFGMAGMTAIAILMYLYARHRDAQMRAVLLAAGVVSGISIVMSGSRAAVVVAAVLVLIMPFVERSALSGFVVAILGAIALVSLPLIVQGGYGGSALTRLAGSDGTVVIADQARSDSLEYGLERLWDSPIIGSGLVDLELIHNIFVEVAVGVGVFGFVGYLMVMYVLTRPLLSNHVHRRLSYLPLAFLGIAPALPGLWDRTMWVPIGLAILAALDDEEGAGTPAEDESADLARPARPTVARLERGSAV